MNATQGRIVVERTDEKDIHMRDLYVRVDDMDEQTLHFGQKLDMSLPAGPHQIKITNRLFSESEEFELPENGTVEFSALNVWMKSIAAPLFIIGGTGPYKVELKRR